MQIEALIEKLEGLRGPDREVDALVMQAAFPSWAKIGAPYLSPHCIGDEPIYWHAPQGSPYQKMPVPELTASLDAAIALVEGVKDRLPRRVTWWTILKDAMELQGWMTGYNQQEHPDPKDLPRFVCVTLLRVLAAGGCDDR